MATQRKLTKETRRARRSCTEKVGSSRVRRNPRTLLSFYLAKEGWVANIRQGDVIERHVVAKSANNVEMDRSREAEARKEAERLVKEGR